MPTTCRGKHRHQRPSPYLRLSRKTSFDSLNLHDILFRSPTTIQFARSTSTRARDTSTLGCGTGHSSLAYGCFPPTAIKGTRISVLCRLVQNKQTMEASHLVSSSLVAYQPHSSLPSLPRRKFSNPDMTMPPRIFHYYPSQHRRPLRLPSTPSPRLRPPNLPRPGAG